MTVEAVLGRDYVARTLPLVQYDEGQKIHLSGIDLPASYLAEFSNCENGTAPQITQTTDTIEVPKEYLESGDPVHIWIVVTGPDERTTRYEIHVPVEQRCPPANYVPTPSEKTAIEAAIEALNEAVADSQTAVTHYPRIVDGMWEVWDPTNNRWVSTFVKAEGDDGRSIIGAELNEDYTLTLTFSDNTTYTTPSIRGGEGYSPSATVTKDGNTATITITDQNGTTTANVYDADPTTIIDDAAGIGATGKVWSANKNATALSGKADLDTNGKVPASQLPSYVDDVLEYADLAHFPAEGETGKIYIALDTNKEYRWGGSEYAEISASLALGETSSTAYRGDRGKIAYAHAIAKGISAAAEVIYKFTTNAEGHVVSAVAATLGDLTALGVAPRNNPDFTTSVSMGRKANTTVGSNSVAVGYEVTASGGQSHAEGNSTTASEMASHAEGYGTVASGYFSHAEGNVSTAQGHYSHAEGGSTLASESYSHAEGQATQATGYTSHAEGSYSKATESYAHAEGSGTTASGNGAHAEGAGSKAQGAQSHAEGAGTTASGEQSHAEGSGSQAQGAQSHAEGSSTAIGSKAHAEGSATVASGGSAHSEGGGTTASGPYSHAEGAGTTATQSGAHAEGSQTTASANGSHAEGYNTKAQAQNAHAEGSSTTASGSSSHAEGNNTTASGSYSHAEGNGTTASNYHAHAEGSGTTASAYNAHAEGEDTTASGRNAHAEGNGTIAEGDNSHAGGKWNVADANDTYANIIGNGTADNARSNAYALDWNGDGRYKGDVYVGCNSDSTGGTKVAKITDIPTVPVTDVQVNGTSILSNGVANVPLAGYDHHGVVQIANTYGMGITSGGHIFPYSATAADIKAASSGYKVISPYNQHTSAFYALAKAAGDTTQSQSSNPVGTYTDDAKTAIRGMLGAVGDVQVNGTSILNNGVANVPLASTSVYGVLMAERDEDAKSGLSTARAVTPARQEKSTFYGLAKAAGDSTQSASSNAVGNYTPEAKAAIWNMLGLDGSAFIRSDWELIREDTVTNATEADIEITVDGNGQAFELTDLVLLFETPKQATASAKGQYGDISFYAGNDLITQIECGSWTQEANTASHGITAIVKQEGNMLIASGTSQTTTSNRGNVQWRYGFGFDNTQQSVKYLTTRASFTKINIIKVTGTGHYKLYGKRKRTALGSAVINVSGSTPSITALPGHRYICGECATLSFTPSASGDCEVIFESGSTATDLTLPNTVKMPDWFDATSLEANRAYDIIITNGVYGVVTSWA